MEKISAFQPPPAEYPNYLALAQPERRRVATAYWTLLVLLALCAAPRAMIALRIPGIAGDGVHYVNAARALEAGDFRNSLWEGGLNIYVVILAILHQTGLDWEIAAEIWGVTVSCLVLLPLWGWVRRQFDDRVALIACLLYIIHPKFILESPELMRDPTFWFFLTTAIYFLWRAETEVRYRHFMVAGAAITLASLTRVEGLLLLIPLVIWTFWRCLALKTDRRKLIVGAVLCVTAFPLLLVLVNLVFLYGYSDWAAIRMKPLMRAQTWMECLFAGSAPEIANQSAPSAGRILWRFFPTMTRGLSPVFALLMFGGIWGWRRIWSRRDNQALFLTVVALLGGIWVQAWSNRYLQANINARYALPVVLMAAPFAALGLLAFTARALKFFERVGFGNGSRAAALSAVVVLTIVPSAADVLHNNLTNYGFRRTTTEIGKWARHEYLKPARIAGPWDMVLPVGYYAGSKSLFNYRYDDDDATILKRIKPKRTDIVLLQANEKLTAERCDSLVERLKSLDFKLISMEALPNVSGNCRVLARDEWLEASRRSESMR